MGAGDMGYGGIGFGGAYSMPMMSRRGGRGFGSRFGSRGISDGPGRRMGFEPWLGGGDEGGFGPMLPPRGGGYRPGRGFGYRGSGDGYDYTQAFAGIGDPYADIPRYGYGAETANAFPWLDDDYNPNPPPPGGSGTGGNPTDSGGGSDPGGGGESGGHGYDYAGMSKEDFNTAAQNRANSGWLDRNMPGAMLGAMLPGGGLLAGIGGWMDDRNFANEQAVRSADFRGRGQSMPDEDMAYGGGYSGGAGIGGGNADAWGGTGEKNAKGGRPSSERPGGSPGIGAVQGDGDGRDDKVPALLSDGEHVIPADVVAAMGRGSSKAGHKALNDLILKKRAQYRKTLGKLPPPKG